MFVALSFFLLYFARPFHTITVQNVCDVKLYYKCFIYLVPSEIKARGPGAQIAYENALKTGKVKVYRARIMLIGQDRAGKTSLRKSFLGLPFDPEEESTDGIEVDPSKFEVDTDLVKNWKRTDEKLEVSQFAADLARMVARELQENADDEEEGDEEINGEDNEFGKEGDVNLVQVNQRGVTSEYPATKTRSRLVECQTYLKGLGERRWERGCSFCFSLPPFPQKRLILRLRRR